MEYKKIIFFTLLTLLFASCKSTQTLADKPENWHNIAVIEDVEIYIDTASIRHEGAVTYAREKRVYISDKSRKAYADKIKAEYTKMGKPEKADKWIDFSYCIYNCLYECTNKRFRVLSVEDFDSLGNRIVRTTHAKNNIRWLNVENDTVGDYTFFFVCDYEQ
ncbi:MULTISPECIES: surface-adhesin E family protein [unclassified Dysgonomonas]|uniref:surface-adhesin E family protein n=1 Tax=unclassified Dysgonomonas TaxID=2630389 RepID=UPI0013ECA9B2|nr:MULTISPECIES: surface-adhesin E family protein [unclassified Dysgonomonas]